MFSRTYLALLAISCLTACGGGDSSNESGDSTPGGVISPVTTEIAVNGMELRSTSGHVFIPRGINLQYGDNPTNAYPALAQIASAKANIVRLQLRNTTTAEQLKTALDQIVAQGMVAMPMYWEEDITCKSDATVLQSAVDSLWLERWKEVLLDPAYAGKIMINIANEWGSSTDFTTYINTYKTVIGQFREAGFQMPLVIDGADCGQNADSFTDQKRYASLQNADALKNIVFSLHAYNYRWNSAQKVEAIMNSYQKLSLPLLIGEFGDSEFEAGASNNVDHLQLMASANQRDIGWIAWSWYGNGSGYEVLNMSENYGWALTRRGDEIINGEPGLGKNSQLIE